MARSKLFEDKKIVCFHLEKEEKKKLKEYAKDMGMGISTYLRWLIKEKLKELENARRVI